MTDQTNFTLSRRSFLKGAASVSALSISGLSSLAFAGQSASAVDAISGNNVLSGSGIRVIQETLFNKEKVTLINESGKLQMLDVRQPISLHQANGKLVVTVNQDDAAAVSGFAYNQGFYNLFLALTSAYGYYLMLSEKTFHFGAGMLCASSIVQAGAGFILFSSGGKKYVIVACMQGLAPLLIIYRIFNWY